MPFAQLGKDIAQAWHAYRDAPAAFPTVAHRVLEAADISPAAYMWMKPPREFSAGADRDARAPLIHYREPSRFRIEGHISRRAWTTISDDSFVGASRVVHGSAVQSLYEFAGDTPNQACQVSTLSQTKASIIRQGKTREMTPEERFVRWVFPLDDPLIEIVVRTDDETRVRRRYYWPGIALNDRATEDPVTWHWFASLAQMARGRSSDFPTTLTDLAGGWGDAEIFHVLLELLPIMREQRRLEIFQRLIDALTVRLDDRTIVAFQSALWRQERVDAVRHVFQRTSDPSLRVFLAGLATQQQRTFLVRLLEEHGVEKDAMAEQIAAWLAELTKEGELKPLELPKEPAPVWTASLVHELFLGPMNDDRAFRFLLEHVRPRKARRGAGRGSRR